VTASGARNVGKFRADSETGHLGRLTESGGLGREGCTCHVVLVLRRPDRPLNDEKE
jgi:hypothetical protein